ncbi:hypothetical protein DIPPA_64998 [Diplonema papillatum]|nr:hypothetical protein DIPPA_64997 [Diplonema papillatum]KAJ9451657.1 hypothetical protein DIPPA_64998 [Diplonema papillatum]
MSAAKIVIVGDGAVGKTSLLWRWAKKEFKPEHEPTVFENYCTAVPVSGPQGERQQKLTLWDTGGQEPFDKLRRLSYPGTHIFLVCFSVNNRASFQNVKSIWMSEIRAHVTPTTRVILVGTKLDLREGDGCVVEAEGKALQQEISAEAYIECSAKTETNVKKVFDAAIRAFLKPAPPPQPAAPPKKGCVIL